MRARTNNGADVVSPDREGVIPIPAQDRIFAMKPLTGCLRYVNSDLKQEFLAVGLLEER